MVYYSKILGTGGYLPAQTLSNADLEKMVHTTDAWIVERTGIRNRHIMGQEETVASMAEQAARRALEMSEVDAHTIECIIVATSTSDRLFPSTACVLQHRLGIHNQCPAFDLSAACSGFLYALSVADHSIRSGAIKTALVVGVDALTRLVDWTDRSTCILFSDGAAAVVLGSSQEPGVISTTLHADGHYAELLHADNHLGPNAQHPPYIHMQGREVFKIAVNTLNHIVEETLEKNQLTKQAIDWLIPHQANLRIIHATAKKLGLPLEKVIVTVQDQGNCSAASVPLALDIGIRDGRIQRGELLLLEAFGAGFTWGSALIRY